MPVEISLDSGEAAEKNEVEDGAHEPDGVFPKHHHQSKH
jgi:hypothetical protein